MSICGFQTIPSVLNKCDMVKKQSFEPIDISFCCHHIFSSYYVDLKNGLANSCFFANQADMEQHSQSFGVMFMSPLISLMLIILLSLFWSQPITEENMWPFGC